MSKVVMYLENLKEFTRSIALAALEQFAPQSDLSYVTLTTDQLNLINHGLYDHDMKKYVISIGDGLYQIVAYANDKLYAGGTGATVAVDYFQLCGVRRHAEEYKMKCLDYFTPDFAFDFFVEVWKPSHNRLKPSNLQRINKGIFDSNMVKYVVSEGFMLYQIAAIKSELDANFVSVVSTASSI